MADPPPRLVLWAPWGVAPRQPMHCTNPPWVASPFSAPMVPGCTPVSAAQRPSTAGHPVRHHPASPGGGGCPRGGDHGSRGSRKTGWAVLPPPDPTSESLPLGWALLKYTPSKSLVAHFLCSFLLNPVLVMPKPWPGCQGPEGPPLAGYGQAGARQGMDRLAAAGHIHEKCPLLSSVFRHGANILFSRPSRFLLKRG